MFAILKNVITTGRVTETKSSETGFFHETSGAGLVEFNAEKCAACRDHVCVKSCPTGAVVEKNGRPVCDGVKCIECRVCEDVCPAGAVSPVKFGIGSARMNMALEKLEGEIRANFGGSFHIRQLDAGSCNGCEHEMISSSNPVFDLSRFGIDYVASPRHADCLLVTGPVSWNLKEALIRTVEATPKPRVVIAMGTCACSGAPFAPNYAHHSGADKIVPVDVYIPGCPPHPYSLICGILNAMKKLKSEK